MKKQNLLSFLFIVLLFFGCTPDGDVDMPTPEKSVEELIKGTWSSTMSISRKYDYAPNDLLGKLLWEGKSMEDINNPVNYIKFDGEIMNKYWETGYEDNSISEIPFRYFISNRAGNNYIKYYDENENVPESFEITHISDKKMIWQQVIRTDKSYEDNTWRKTVNITEFVRR